MFELSQLRIFVALAEELHFGRAAARLNMTQPPLSRQLQQMEQALGVSLVERSSRFVRLTSAGRSLLADARAILRAAEEAAVSVRKVARGEGGVITLGFIPATSYDLLPRLIAFAAAEMPHVQFNLREMVTADQAEALALERLDAGILRMPIDRRGLEAIAISRDPFVVALPKGKVLGDGRALTIADLDRQPLVMYAPVESRYHYDLVSSVFRAAGIVPNFVQYAREIHTMLALVGAGIGCALIPSVGGNLGLPSVSVRPIALKPEIFSEMTIVWRRSNGNPALRTFVNDVLPKFLRE